MNVENPVGFVNINVPPSLPGGLESLRLFRGRLDNAAFNIATEQSDTFVEDGVVSYSGTYFSPTNRDDGFSSPDTKITYSTGFTWVSVATLDPLGKIVTMSSNDARSGSEGLWLELRDDQVRFNHRMPNDTNPMTSASVPESSDFFMVFVTYDPVGSGEADIMVYIPHMSETRTATISTEGADLDENAGLAHRSIAISTDQGVPTDGKMAMAATFNRALSESEMSSMYSSMKPWLLQRGVSIK